MVVPQETSTPVGEGICPLLQKLKTIVSHARAMRHFRLARNILEWDQASVKHLGQDPHLVQFGIVALSSLELHQFTPAEGLAHRQSLICWCANGRWWEGTKFQGLHSPAKAGYPYSVSKTILLAEATEVFVDAF